MTPEEVLAYSKKYCLPLQLVNDLIMEFNSIREISKIKKGKSSIKNLTSNSNDTQDENHVEDENQRTGISICAFWEFFTPFKEKNKNIAVKILNAIGLKIKMKDGESFETFIT